MGFAANIRHAPRNLVEVAITVPTVDQLEYEDSLEADKALDVTTADPFTYSAFATLFETEFTSMPAGRYRVTYTIGAGFFCSDPDEHAPSLNFVAYCDGAEQDHGVDMGLIATPAAGLGTLLCSNGFGIAYEIDLAAGDHTFTLKWRASGEVPDVHGYCTAATAPLESQVKILVAAVRAPA